LLQHRDQDLKENKNMPAKKTKSKERMADAQRNLERIRKVLAPYEKKKQERRVEPTHGKWVNSSVLAAGAEVEPAPG
jgi:hypothetical protein